MSEGTFSPGFTGLVMVCGQCVVKITCPVRWLFV